MNRRDAHKLAGDAGFGGQQRNTLAVKIEALCNLAEMEGERKVAMLMIEAVEGYDPEDPAVSGRGVLAAHLIAIAKQRGYID